MDLLQQYPQLYQCDFSWLDPNLNLVLIFRNYGVHLGGIYAALALYTYTALVVLVTLCLHSLMKRCRKSKRKSEASVEEAPEVTADPAIVCIGPTTVHEEGPPFYYVVNELGRAKRPFGH